MLVAKWCRSAGGVDAMMALVQVLKSLREEMKRGSFVLGICTIFQ